MKLFLLITLVIFPGFIIAQVNPLYLEPTRSQADSLRALLNQNINDTSRMAAYRELALFYLDINSDSALYFIERGLPLTQKLQLKLWEADAWDLTGLITANQGNYARSLKAYNEALKITENKECEKNIWHIIKFTDSKNPELARLSMLATVLSDLRGLYGETENYEKELQVVRTCFAVSAKINDNTLLSQAYRHLGQINFRNNQLDSALIYLKKSLEYSDKAGYSKYSNVAFNDMGDIYLKKQMKTRALENYRNALHVSMEQNNYWGIGTSYISLANYYQTINKNDSALYYATMGLATLKNTGQVRYYLNAYNSLASIYKNLGKPDSALVYIEFAVAVKDSLINLEKIKQFQNVGFDEELRLQELEKESIKTKNKTRTYSLLSGLGIILIIAFILYRNNHQKQKVNKVLNETLSHLKSTQSQLIQSEKMASLGELTAGIAHEIQNPLNFVNNFSEVNTELIKEIQDERRKTPDKRDEKLEDELLQDIVQNQEKINHHGKRAADIVKGMLQHSRSSSGQKELTDINALCDEYLRLSYHGLRAKDKTFNAKFETHLNPTLPKVNVVPQDIGRVILNLINNAFYATSEKSKVESKKSDSRFEPTVTVSTKHLGDKIEISVKDNGLGIPEHIKEKIFQPFFTTKPTGQGTGLGLSLSYDIIKAHGGEIKVDTTEGTGTTFTITLHS
jgi:signal transduction histidine kinase